MWSSIMLTKYIVNPSENPGEHRLDPLGFRRAIVDAYYRLYRKSLASTTLFTGSRNLHHPANNLQFDGVNHWIAKGSQRQCSLTDFKKTLYIIAKNALSVFMLNVLYYITVSRAVCKVYLDRRKKVICKKVILHFLFSLYS